MDDRIPSAAPIAALVLGTLITLASFYPILAPLQDSSMVFARGDLVTIGGNNSGALRMEQTLSTFSDGSGRKDTNRFLLLSGLSVLSNWVQFTDAQFYSALILLSTVLGCLGVYFLVRRFAVDWRLCSAAILVFIPFYFLNLWSVERIGHIWIWFTYAVFPLFTSVGLSCLESRKDSRLLLYSLTFAFYGALPHSFIYLAMIHGLLAVYSFSTGSRWGDIARFFLVPLAIYLLLYLPFLLIITASEAEYPVDVTKDSFTYLSKNGDLANLLTLTNNWWPSLDSERIQSSWATRYSSFGIFILAFTVFLLSFSGLARDLKALSGLSALWMMACMFIAQGNQNQVMKSISDAVVDAGLGILLGPFREWARICLLIPLLLVMMMSIGLPRMRWGMAGMCILAALVATSIIFSPAWAYLSDIHGAARMGDELSVLGGLLPMDSKVLWADIRMGGLPATTIDGEPIRVRAPLENAGDSYQYPPIIRKIKKEPAPDSLLDALNIHYVVKKDGTRTDSWYAGMDCDAVGYFQLCFDGRAPEPFRIYRGTMIAGDSDVMSLSVAPFWDFAPSHKALGEAEYAVWGSEHNVAGTGQDNVYILEGESAFGGKKIIGSRMGASNNSYAVFKDTLQASVNISKAGTYRIAAVGNGPVEISVDGAAAAQADSMEGFAYSGPVYLDAGRANVTVGGNGNASLDVVWIFPDSANGTVDTLFKMAGPPPASVISFEREGPTRWRAWVNSSRPFLLSFAESYSPGWEARIIEDGKIAEAYEPVELFGAINGYWINRTGDLEIEFRHRPQDLFGPGLLVTGATLAACAAFLGYALWRGD